MWHRRWSGIIGIAGQRALATSLLSLLEVYGAGETIPSLDEVLAEGRYVLETDDTPTSGGSGASVDPYPGSSQLNTSTPGASGGAGR